MICQKKTEPLIDSFNKKKKINQKSKTGQKPMSVHEGKMFQCSNCNEKFNSKIRFESRFAKKHDG